MNIVLPVDIQSYIPSQNATGTAQARADNNSRPAIEPAQHNPAAKQSTQRHNEPAASFASHQGQSASKDKVSLSKQGQEALKQDASKKDASKKDSITELSEEDKKAVQDLKDRDREVKVHEQAHAAVGGQYAGSPSYEYQTGPDGKRYAVGGEVSIDVSEENEPEDTVQKMQIVRAAALAPAEPSTQDLKVAAEASQKEQQARAEVSESQLKPDEESEDENSQPAESKSNSVSHQQSKLAQAYSDFSASKTQSQFSTSA